MERAGGVGEGEESAGWIMLSVRRGMLPTRIDPSEVYVKYVNTYRA